MQSWDFEGDDLTLILKGIFDANAKLDAVGENVVAIRRLLEEDDGEEEEDWPDS